LREGEKDGEEEEEWRKRKRKRRTGPRSEAEGWSDVQCVWGGVTLWGGLIRRREGGREGGV
jgi:hypothetical protein